MGRPMGDGWAFQGRRRGVLWALLGSQWDGWGALLGDLQGCRQPQIIDKPLKFFYFLLSRLECRRRPPCGSRVGGVPGMAGV